MGACSFPCEYHSGCPNGQASSRIHYTPLLYAPSILEKIASARRHTRRVYSTFAIERLDDHGIRKSVPNLMDLFTPFSWSISLL
jgi:hypothetical protein